jgi:hypothetical protein
LSVPPWPDLHGCQGLFRVDRSIRWSWSGVDCERDTSWHTRYYKFIPFVQQGLVFVGMCFHNEVRIRFFEVHFVAFFLRRCFAGTIISGLGCPLMCVCFAQRKQRFWLKNPGTVSHLPELRSSIQGLTCFLWWRSHEP